MSQIKFDEYTHCSVINNAKVEWLIKHGNINNNVFFKGETGDRYSIYIFIKRNKNNVDIYSIWNQYGHDTDLGSHIATLNKDYTLKIMNGKKWGWKGAAGEIFKQLMRQGVCPYGAEKGKDKIYSIRYCRSAYFVKTHDGNEFTPWLGMKINLKTGLLVNKPTREAKNEYNTAKNQDKAQRKRNYIANRENTKALNRYRNAGGDTEVARGWRGEPGKGTENIDWDMIPMDDVFRHRNATLRSNIIEHYGMNAIVGILDHQVVDQDTIDGRLYKLLDVTIPDFSDNSPGFDGSYKGLYLEMINPSTGESHFEGIPNVQVSKWGSGLKEATVKAALAWRDDDLSIMDGNNWRNQHPEGNDYIKPIILK